MYEVPTDKGIFGGSRLVRRVLVPAVALSAFIYPATLRNWDLQHVLPMIGIELVLLLFLAAIAAPQRFRWAGRLLCGGVFVFYLSYLAIILIDPSMFAGGKSGRVDRSPWMAGLRLIGIGLPCLWYAVRGRFSFGAPAAEAFCPTRPLPSPPSRDDPHESN